MFARKSRRVKRILWFAMVANNAVRACPENAGILKRAIKLQIIRKLPFPTA
jgi:hypothetical protein